MRVTILSALSATNATLGGSRAVAAGLIAAFLLAGAFAFSVLASRALQARLRGFLQAARRLGSGDSSSPIKVDGRDEFASLAEEFNSMSSELSRRLDELSRERARFCGAIRRIGHTFRFEPRSSGPARARRQAVTDELTGLTNHGRFQELLNSEI